MVHDCDNYCYRSDRCNIDDIQICCDVSETPRITYGLFLRRVYICIQADKKPERYLKWANAFIVVYSIVCRGSFDEASRYLDVISKYQRLSGNDGPVALVGNKADLERYR